MEIKDFLKSKGINEDLSMQFFCLMDVILSWNEKINVTAIKDPEDFMRKNIIDSLTLVGRPEIECSSRILDLGTGGGFPGLPLALIYPEKNFILMDAVGKKLKVVEAASLSLGLSNVQTLHMRAEDMAKDKAFRESFDLVVSRAVANMSTLSEYCIPFVKPGGHFVAYKTSDANDEILSAKKALDLLGCSDIDIYPDGIEGSGHIFAVCRKVKTTPLRFPRKAGIPSKNPL